MENPNDMGASPATERVSAQATVETNWVLPRHKVVERVGTLSSGVTTEHPKVRGGICEWCGVLDANQPSHFQYKLCPHYRGMQLQCSYCPGTKDADDVINHSVLRVLQHPDNPDKLIIHCDSYECLKKHEERFKVSS